MNYYKRVMPSEAVIYGEEALHIARTNGYQKGEADELYLLGVCYHAQSNYAKALEYYQSSYEIRKKQKDNVGIGECLNRIGLIYNVRGDLEKALDYCLQSVRILENEQNKKVLAESYNHLGILYYIMNDIKKAEEISVKALKFSEKINEDLVLAVSHEHLGVIYIKTGEYDKAIYHVNKSLELRLAKNDRIGLSGSYENLAIIYRQTKKYDTALKFYGKSLELKKELNNKRGIASSISGMGITYFNMGKYEESLSHIKQALEMRKQLGDKRGIVSSLNRLAETYSAMNNYKIALDHYKLAKIYNDSLLNEQKNKEIAKFQEAFQHERRQQEILLLQKESTIQKYLRNSLIVVTILLSAIAIFIFMAYRSKRKINTFLSNHNNQVTEQKEELQTLNKQLIESNATKDKFFSLIAHDLKSPFQGFLSLTQIISEQSNSFSASELNQLGGEMHKTAQNLFTLLRNLLEWAQMQRGSINFQPVSFSLTDLIEENIQALKNRSEQKEITIINAVTDLIQVYADKKMINSILSNLLSNAIKFTQRNGMVTVKANKISPKIVEISISDTGIGISQNLIEKLFKVGEKIGLKGTDGELSTGLGLLLCKEFVEKHDGQIWVESLEGKGSTFHFTLQLTDNIITGPAL